MKRIQIIAAVLLTVAATSAFNLLINPATARSDMMHPTDNTEIGRYSMCVDQYGYVSILDTREGLLLQIDDFDGRDSRFVDVKDELLRTYGRGKLKPIAEVFGKFPSDSIRVRIESMIEEVGMRLQ